MLDDTRADDLQASAVAALTRSYELGPLTTQLALAVLALCEDRRQWRSYAERIAPAPSSANSKGYQCGKH